ncbi:MAG: alpha/beta hydrolase, partial [Bacteroidetes bacterium]|nr:alpha/beta hydrolase [Bacteroidota bacterium]
PHPVIIIVPGSGKTTREAANTATEIFVPQGVAVLRYDKRGVGESTGLFEGPGAETSIRIFDDLASDVLALIGFLKNQQDIKPEQIGLFGTSQGGWIVPLVASQSNDVAFMICASGATNTVGISDYYDLLADNMELSIDEIIEMLHDFTGVHGFDPLPSLEALTIPGLWIYGGQDRSNPTQADIAILETLIADFGKDFTILLFPSSNHDLIDLQTNEFDPEFVPSLLGWVLTHLSNS